MLICDEAPCLNFISPGDEKKIVGASLTHDWEADGRVFRDLVLKFYLGKTLGFDRLASSALSPELTSVDQPEGAC